MMGIQLASQNLILKMMAPERLGSRRTWQDLRSRFESEGNSLCSSKWRRGYPRPRCLFILDPTNKQFIYLCTMYVLFLQSVLLVWSPCRLQ